MVKPELYSQLAQQRGEVVNSARAGGAVRQRDPLCADLMAQLMDGPNVKADRQLRQIVKRADEVLADQGNVPRVSQDKPD